MSEWQVINGDSLDVLKQLPDACIDSLVTDPPAGIRFMGKSWDSDKGGRVDWISWLEATMREVLRVLKPGAHGLVWALPRTSHWTATALEQAGFQVRDIITHHYAVGFPKSLNVSKAIDEAAGAVREVVGEKVSPDGIPYSARHGEFSGRHGGGLGGAVEGTPVSRASELITAPATDAAKQWAGFGTALKPATEHWILVRKPLSGTVAANVQEHGTGALNIDACRIEGAPRDPGFVAPSERADGWGMQRGAENYDKAPEGRWPANLVFSHTEWCEPLDETITIKSHDNGRNRPHPGIDGGGFVDTGRDGRANVPSGVLHGDDRVVRWRCLPGCPVALLDAQSGQTKPGGSIGAHTAAAASPDGRTVFGNDTGARGAWNGHGDKGGASRFFYVSKPSTKEREDGLDHLPKKSRGEIVDRAEDSAGINNPRAGAGRTAKGRANFHPTVKSIGLMLWLVKLISPPGGVVLDPFCGSGTTGVAAVKGGWSFLGIEKDPEYMPIAEGRIGHANGEALSSPAIVPDLVLSPGAILCMVCHEPQFETTGGFTCENGHGGALSTSVASLTGATASVVDLAIA